MAIMGRVGFWSIVVVVEWAVILYTQMIFASDIVVWFWVWCNVSSYFLLQLTGHCRISCVARKDWRLEASISRQEYNSEDTYAG